MKRAWIGVDPGVHGSFAAITDAGELRVLKHLGEKHEAEIFSWLYELLEDGYATAGAVIEKVSSSPQMGVVSAFTFGREFGRVCTALGAAGTAYRLVTPQRWQKELGCLTRGDKKVTKAYAAALFPSHKVTLADADAICIAEYARRTS
jgi:hypothetical protein